MANRFFRYSGSKLNYIKHIIPLLNQSKKKIYVEPFAGSGAILFNLEKEFEHYMINDIDKNIIRIYKTFQKVTFKEYQDSLLFIERTFGDIQDSKDSYYKFRDWFNVTYWNKDTIEEGLYLHALSNSCINSLLRFGPSGMNQSWGNRLYKMDRQSFSAVTSKLSRTELMNTSYKNAMLEYEYDAVYFLDPPYYNHDVGYDGFNLKEFTEFIDFILPYEYIYTDILNEINSNLPQRIKISDMRTVAPSSSKDISHNEVLFTSIKLSKKSLF